MISKKKLVYILLPFVLLPILLIVNANIYSSVGKTERVWMPTPLGEVAHGCLYHPKNPHPSRPIIIVFHGLTWTNSLDLRWPLELTKRGFYVLSVDQSGHGYTYGAQPGLQDDVLKPFFFRNVIGVVDYIYSRQDLFNISAIGCMGQSLGGWTTLFASTIEPRINASVSLAGPTNITALAIDANFSGLFKNIGVTLENDFIRNPDLQVNHSILEYFNGTYGVNPPKNLLLIHGRNDIVVNVSHAIDAYNLVNDTSKCDIFIVDGAGSDHALINHSVVSKTIEWFESKLLGKLQSPIDSSEYTYIQFYITYIMLLVSIYSSVFGINFILFKLKDRYISSPPKSEAQTPISEEKTYRSAFLNLIIYSLPVLGIWLGLYFIQNLVFNYLVTLLIGALLLIIYEFLFFYLKSKESFHKNEVKEVIKSNIELWGIVIAVLCAVYFLGFYYVVTFSYKFLMIGPQSLPLYILSILAIFPFVLSYEIFHRKLIQEQFPSRFERGKWLNRVLLEGFAIISYIPLYYVTLGSFLAVLVVLIFFIAVTTINIYLYEKTQSTLATSIFGAIVVAFFIAHCYFLFI